MNQVQENSRITNVREIIKMFFKALSENDSYISDPEEVVKKSGNEELIKSSEKIKNLEAMFNDTKVSRSKMRDNLKNTNRDETDKSPRIKGSTIHTAEKKMDDNGLEL